MTSADPREDVVVDGETLHAYEAPPAPADMADRVLAGLRAEEIVNLAKRKGRRGSRSLRRWIAVAAAVVVATAVMLTNGSGGDVASRGHRVAGARASIAIGDRAVAVAEAGSKIAWTVLADGAATVDQARGSVFYRVTPGQPFDVVLPSATVRVLGTSFRVEVTDMRWNKKLVAAGATGAALSAAVLVTVHEGKVLLGNEQGEVLLAPGEQGTAAGGAPPARAGVAVAADSSASTTALEARVRGLEQKLRRTEKMLAEAPAGPTDRPEQQFAAEQRDPSWAAGQEQRVLERLTRIMGLERGSVDVECRRSCCQIAMDPEEMSGLMLDLQSDVGLGPLQGSEGGGMSFTGREDGASLVSFCVSRKPGEPGKPRPDRGEEREALLAAARPAVDACMRGKAEPLDFEIHLRVDPEGKIDDYRSNADPVGHPAAACVELAVLAAARFAPSTRATSVPVRLHLEPLP